MILYENIKLNRTQIFADPPAMRGTSGQVYTDNIIIYNLKNFLPARSCPWPPRRARPPSAAPQANAGQAWLAGELAVAGGSVSQKRKFLYYELNHRGKPWKLKK
jgi:hypothetical protein